MSEAKRTSRSTEPPAINYDGLAEIIGAANARRLFDTIPPDLLAMDLADVTENFSGGSVDAALTAAYLLRTHEQPDSSKSVYTDEGELAPADSVPQIEHIEQIGQTALLTEDLVDNVA